MKNKLRGSGRVSMRRAAAIQFASKYVSLGAQLVITAVLARLISPEEFGLLAIITVFTAFFSLFSDMGIGVAIVQFRDLGERDFGALFVFSALIAFALAGLFCALSPAVAAFYGEPSLMPLCCAASLSLVFSTLNMVPNGLMLRERRFGSIGLRLVVATAVSGVAAIASAFFGAGVYSLIVQVVTSSAIVFIWNYTMRPIGRLSIHFVAPLRRIISYSGYQFGFSAINYFARNLDTLLIGKALGVVAVGNYDKAYKLTGYPLSSFSSVVASVVQPYMAEHQDNKDVVFAYWMKIEKGLSLAGACIMAVFVSAAAEIVGLFYGSQWGAAIPPFAILSFSVYFQVVWNPSGAFFQSLGRTDLMFKAGVVNTLLTISGLLVGLAGGSIVSVSVGIAVAYCLHSISLCWFLLWKCFGVKPAKLLSFLPEFATALVAIVACEFASPYFPAGMFPSFCCKVLLAGAVLLLGFGLTGQLSHLRALLCR
ncbi:lipopolysaccharide biosynthesis protein [Adlercreutzia faecimuris]|uniref:Lipopolysaccharide biosynthesis protein n=1 Tax=Adlercreutzia faecimuris TaxID=2897341 RepID=A0ABS9WIL9_9ACTN|nr:lipopolysaccharide biosynthesis protein [Adlercreutzia sp. JBNU-10]